MARTGQNRLATLTALAVASLGAGALALVLGAVALAAARPGRPVAVQDVVSVAVAALGAVTAAWLAASCALGWACLARRVLGAQWRAGEVVLRRCAPVVVRRAVAGAVGASLGLGLVATGAHAAPVVESAGISTSAAATTATSSQRATTGGAATGGAATGGAATGGATTDEARGSATDTGSDGFAGAPSDKGRDTGVAPVPATVSAPDPAAPPLTWQVTPGPESAAGEARDDAPGSTTGAAGAEGATTPAPDSTAPDSTAPERTVPGSPADASGASSGTTDRQGVDLAAHATDAFDAAGAAPEQTTETAPSPVVVTRGDTLWSIAAAHLADDASTADIAAAWPRWYEANRDVIGDDPDVLLVGQQLEVPMENAR